MDKRKELQAIQKRVEIVLTALDGRSVRAIAEKLGVSRPTVRKWTKAFEEHGPEGLLSRSKPGRPRQVSEAIRKELVRLPQDTRPPLDLGESPKYEPQWSSRLLGDTFGISSSVVSEIWKEFSYDAPLHLQQVDRNPDQMVPLRIDLQVPAWVKMRLQMFLEMRGWTLEQYLLARLTGDWTPDEMDPWHEIREETLKTIKDPDYRREYWQAFIRREVVDPRKVEYDPQA